MKILNTKLSIVLVTDNLKFSYMFGISLKISGCSNDLFILNYRELFDEENYVWKHFLNDGGDNPSGLLIVVDCSKMEQSLEAWHGDLSKFALKIVGGRSNEIKSIRICYLACDRCELARIQNSLSKEEPSFSLPCGVVERPVTMVEVNDLLADQSMLMGM